MKTFPMIEKEINEQKRKSIFPNTETTETFA